MPAWLMWTIAIAVVILPVVLMLALNGRNEADSRGRRISRRWHT